MRCKQHQACANNMMGNPSQCRPDLTGNEGPSVCRQCCDSRTDQCNLELYQEILQQPVALQQNEYEVKRMKWHELAQTTPYPTIGSTRLWNGEVVAENDSRAIAQKQQEDLNG